MRMLRLMCNWITGDNWCKVDEERSLSLHSLWLGPGKESKRGGWRVLVGENGRWGLPPTCLLMLSLHPSPHTILPHAAAAAAAAVYCCCSPPLVVSGCGAHHPGAGGWMRRRRDDPCEWVMAESSASRWRPRCCTAGGTGTAQSCKQRQIQTRKAHGRPRYLRHTLAKRSWSISKWCGSSGVDWRAMHRQPSPNNNKGDGDGEWKPPPPILNYTACSFAPSIAPFSAALLTP